MQHPETPRRARCGVGLVLFFGILLFWTLGGCGGADNRPAKWSYIAPAIIEPTCGTVSCHSSIAQRAGVILDTSAKAYNTLITRHFVVTCAAGDTACQAVAGPTSEIISLMRAQGSSRMPPDFALPEVDIQLIENWITNGASPE